MLYVSCPCCESPVEIPFATTEVGCCRLSTVVVCPLCDTAFDSDDNAAWDDEPARR